MKRKLPRPAHPPGQPDEGPVVGLRIIGGTLRGRRLQYSGDLRTRPMKDRVREAVFNLLGPGVKGSHAIDLFAGTGALGLEAISRGAARATMIERHLPTTRLIEQNAAALGVSSQVEVVFADAFIWVKRWLAGSAAVADGASPWTTFCSPPYDFYESRQADMLTMLQRLVEAAPPDSLFAVEADERFDFTQLPLHGQWEVRTYLPAVVGILRK
jgi:16S rRNA (guanine966-N2)-methyltransferase